MIEQPTLAPGQLIHDRYRIDIALAAGGQADVYRAHQIELDREVAIKVLKTHGSEQVRDRTAKRFEQEARLISKLRDPHTITLYDFGRLEDGALFMVFEYIDGISLKELVAQQGPIEPYRVAKILKQTLSSLHEAHSMGVLHRDLKPANIMVYEHAGRKDLVKLLDFGIAKILREEEDGAIPNPNLTGDRIIGTPRYIAPELLLKEPPSAASDLYGLGMVGYELLVGRPAIKERSALQIIARQIDPKDFKLPGDLNVPAQLRDIIESLLIKDPSGRYQDVLTVSGDLKRWMRRSLPPHMESEVFDDFTPPDDVESMKEYDRRSKGKSELSVIVPNELKVAPDLTPRTAFSQSIVFQGKPNVQEVNQLIHKSMKTEHKAVMPGQLSGQSSTSNEGIGVARDHTQQIYVSDEVLDASVSTPAPRRGGDTVGMNVPMHAHTRPRRPVDHQKAAILVIVILVVVILVIGLIFALLVMS